MITNISQTLAQQIVNTVKDVCGQNINFINQSGIIFASTDEERLNTFHEAGYTVFRTGAAVEVESDDSFTGTQRGINLPIYHNHGILAVIGITGAPDEVRKYAHLAERITRLLIREQEISAFSRNQEDKKQYIIHSLIGRQGANADYLKDCLKDFGIDTGKKMRLIIMRIDFRYNPDNIFMIEQKIKQMFESISLTLYAFDYPNEYLAVIDEDSFEKNRYLLQKTTSDYQELLKAAVGRPGMVYQLEASYQSALTAWKSIALGTKSFVVFDELTLEIVLSSMDKISREEFRLKTISQLSKEEISLIKIYYEENMSLTAACSRLFLHKNTLQYKLNRIYQKCGLNPRVFQDAVLLYLAVKM